MSLLNGNMLTPGVVIINTYQVLQRLGSPRSLHRTFDHLKIEEEEKTAVESQHTVCIQRDASTTTE